MFLFNLLRTLFMFVILYSYSQLHGLIKFLILVGLFTSAKGKLYEETLEDDLNFASYVPDDNFYGPMH